MPFKEGFTAIEQIQNSGQKLSEIVARLETLEEKLESLRQVQSQLEVVLARTGTIFGNVQRSSDDLSEQYNAFTEQAKLLPTNVEVALERAEERIVQHQVRMTAILDGLPQLFENALGEKLQSHLSDMETRFSDRLRDELKDTRLAMRDAMEVNYRSFETKLDLYCPLMPLVHA